MCVPMMWEAIGEVRKKLKKPQISQGICPWKLRTLLPLLLSATHPDGRKTSELEPNLGQIGAINESNFEAQQVQHQQ